MMRKFAEKKNILKNRLHFNVINALKQGFKGSEQTP